MARVQQFDYSANLLQVILWQYDQAENLVGILTAYQAWYNENQTEFWTNWYDDVFNLDTANDFGLEIWSIILDINLGNTLSPGGDHFGFVVPTDGPAPIADPTHFNFADGGAGNTPFSNFSPSSSGFILSTEAKRIALKLRYYRLTGHPTVTQANRIVANVFGYLGPVYVVDGLDMTITYVFGFAPDAQLLYLLENFDLLPRPAAVLLGEETTINTSFGFQSPDDLPLAPVHKNYDHGNFYSQGDT